MSIFNKSFYIETSAINYYTQSFEVNDIIATKAFQLAKGNKYLISPICLWEILLTKNEIQKEKIIYYSQNLFHDKLLKSPAEFIVNFIKDNTPNIQKPHSLFTHLEIGDIWEEICLNKNKSINIDRESLQNKTKILRDLSKDLYLIINRINLDINIKDNIFYNQEIIRFYFKDIEDQYGPFSDEKKKIVKISILLVSYVLSGHVDFDPTPYINFWNTLNIKSPTDKILYIFNNYRNIFLVGPFYMMATMAYTQISNNVKSNRGLLLDCLHSIYITYLDVFVTNDKHFDNWSNILDVHNEKILYLGNANFTFHEVSLI